MLPSLKLSPIGFSLFQIEPKTQTEHWILAQAETALNDDRPPKLDTAFDSLNGCAAKYHRIAMEFEPGHDITRRFLPIFDMSNRFWPAETDRKRESYGWRSGVSWNGACAAIDPRDKDRTRRPQKTTLYPHYFPLQPHTICTLCSTNQALIEMITNFFQLHGKSPSGGATYDKKLGIRIHSRT